MATIVAQLCVEALREQYVSSSSPREARHFQTIWLLAKGHNVGEVVEMTSFGRRWVEQLAARYNAEGPESLGDLRRRHGSAATVLKPDILEKLRLRLKEPPDDGGLWASGEAAAFLARTEAGKGRGPTWLGGAEGLRHVDPDAAPEEPSVGFARRSGGVQKKLEDVVVEEVAKHPGRAVEVFASDEHRLGLKPVTRRF